MGNIPLRGNEIIVDTPESVSPAALAFSRQQSAGAALAAWVVGKVGPWEDQRERGYGRLWGEYWRIWRGKWAQEDKNRKSERSRIVAPATSQAVDAAVSEIEEAVFSREVWFDIADDIQDQDRIDALNARDLLLEDFDTVNGKDALSEAILNGAIFGTGVVQISVEVRKEGKPVRAPDGSLAASQTERVYVVFESVRPDQFIPDPSALNVNDGLGVAVRRVKPRHSVLEKIQAGTYRRDALPFVAAQRRTDNRDIDQDDPQSMLSSHESDEVDVIEYHGKVPLRLLTALDPPKSAVDEILAEDNRESSEGEELIESIVTIANGSVLLRAMPSPFTMRDRSIIAFQYEKVPGRFWGRGVVEKGYNPQKALDATIRSYLDALGYVASPMLGIDSGRIPRHVKLEVHPGKVWTTQGNPDEILRPVQIGQLDVNLFQVASDMERMVQMGTGQVDTAVALKNQSQSGANSLSSNSMMMGAFVKRSKRAIANVDRNLLQPVVAKALWRYMQFAPQRYPRDYQFNVKATLGIMAREVEVMQLTQTNAMLGDEHGPVKLAIVQGIIEHSAIANKAQILTAVNKMMAPPDPETQKRQKELADAQYAAALAEAQGKLLQNQKTIAEIKKLLAESLKISHQAGTEDNQQQLEAAQLQVQLAELEQMARTNRAQMVANQKKMEQQDRALDQKDRELDIKEKQANKPTPSTA
jgi:hypothetical protein